MKMSFEPCQVPGHSNMSGSSAGSAGQADGGEEVLIQPVVHQHFF